MAPVRSQTSGEIPVSRPPPALSGPDNDERLRSQCVPYGFLRLPAQQDLDRDLRVQVADEAAHGVFGKLDRNRRFFKGQGIRYAPRGQKQTAGPGREPTGSRPTEPPWFR